MNPSSESNRCFLGLDLGKIRDPSALALVERDEIVLDEMDYANYERRRARRYRVRFLERLRLGTPYPDVVERVREVTARPALAGRCTLVMDATGLGSPVLDLLRRANLRCGIVPVSLTGGERESHSGGVWYVPTRTLVAGLLAMLEKKELELSRRVASTHLLDKELVCMEARVTRSGQVSFGTWREGEHDDLAMAAALACWRARWRSDGIWGTRSLGL